MAGIKINGNRGGSGGPISQLRKKQTTKKTRTKPKTTASERANRIKTGSQKARESRSVASVIKGGIGSTTVAIKNSISESGKGGLKRTLA